MKLHSTEDTFPFNHIEFDMTQIIAAGIITLDQYLDMRSRYLERNRCPSLYSYAPRTFGETWTQSYLNELVPELENPSTATDPDYRGQYDSWYEGIRIEVKASQAPLFVGAGVLCPTKPCPVLPKTNSI